MGRVAYAAIIVAGARYAFYAHVLFTVAVLFLTVLLIPIMNVLWGKGTPVVMGLRALAAYAVAMDVGCVRSRT